MASYGIETASHRSRVACAADLARAALVLAMSRENLRYAVITEPGAWPRAFTLKELIRRGERIGSRPPGEPFSRWLSRAHAGRERATLLGDSAEDDVADPAGGPLRAYADTARLLERLVTRLAELGWAHTGPGPLPRRRTRLRPAGLPGAGILGSQGADPVLERGGRGAVAGGAACVPRQGLAQPACIRSGIHARALAGPPPRHPAL